VFKSRNIKQINCKKDSFLALCHNFPWAYKMLFRTATITEYWWYFCFVSEPSRVLKLSGFPEWNQA
jgi:hypothetical protein